MRVRAMSLGLVILVGCLGQADPEQRAGAQAERGFLPDEPVVDLGADPRFVLRQVLGAEDGAVSSVAGEPFSHRSRSWHVYPFTAYPDARPAVRLTVNDPRLANGASLWLFGPLRSDGGWDAPQRFDATAGVVDVPAMALAQGQYALVVGPRSADAFLPRYPSSLARLRDEAGREVLAQLTTPDDGTPPFFYTEDDARFEIESPAPGTPAPVGGTIVARDASGHATTFTIAAWSSSTWFLPEQARGIEDAVLGNLDGLGAGVLALNPTSDLADEVHLRVLWAVGADGAPSQTPVLLRAVPELVDGRDTDVVEPRDCAAPPCARAVFADDGSAVPDEALQTFRTTAHDFDETSTYDLVVTWVREAPDASGVARAVGGAGTVTHYPVYFAHGFNSSAAVWAPVLTALRTEDARWQGWAQAGDVPPFEPVEVRAEVLRRHLTALLAAAPPTGGERFQRINVIAHSMGGLDTRFLMGSPRYNEQCGALACTDERGQPEACCPADRDGHPVPWRERIASVTTLSTPHCGSTFADLGVSLLSVGWIDFAVDKLLQKYFGLDQAGREAMRRTIFALSTQYCRETMGPSFPVPAPSRQYDWACATGQQSCASPAPAAADAPVRDGGAYRLPSPTTRATVYSWASQSCVTGNCGDALDPGLLVSYLRVKSQEGANDGVVSTQSARFGIFMGIRSNDHFHWNRTDEGGGGGGWRAWLFGVHREPPARFQQYWLGELARAGY